MLIGKLKTYQNKKPASKIKFYRAFIEQSHQLSQTPKKPKNKEKVAWRSDCSSDTIVCFLVNQLYIDAVFYLR